MEILLPDKKELTHPEVRLSRRETSLLVPLTKKQLKMTIMPRSLTAQDGQSCALESQLPVSLLLPLSLSCLLSRTLTKESREVLTIFSVKNKLTSNL